MLQNLSKGPDALLRQCLVWRHIWPRKASRVDCQTSLKVIERHDGVVQSKLDRIVSTVRMTRTEILHPDLCRIIAHIADRSALERRAAGDHAGPEAISPCPESSAEFPQQNLRRPSEIGKWGWRKYRSGAPVQCPELALSNQTKPGQRYSRSASSAGSVQGSSSRST